MSFRQKSISITMVALVVASALYAAIVIPRLQDDGAMDTAYQVPLAVAVIVLVLIAATGHAILAARQPGGTGRAASEHERIALWRGRAAAGYTLAVTTVGVAGLAMAETAWFWIANALAAALVLAELVAGVSTLLILRRTG
ncbi:MAG: hypothetical protein GC156_02750 [Actinomycetales bacterium]|nr:hypothetical protein [Actinomycetales bacterium]